MKNMKLATLLLFSKLLFSNLAFASAISIDELPSGFDLATIAGTYTNDSGDNVSIDLQPAKAKDEPTLFDRPSFHVDIAVIESELGSNRQFWLDESDFEGVDESGILTFETEKECEDSGCTRYVLRVTLTPITGGRYEASVYIDFGAEVDEAFGIDPDEPFYNAADINEFCKNRYGKNAYGEIYENAWCYNVFESVLR